MCCFGYCFKPFSTMRKLVIVILFSHLLLACTNDSESDLIEIEEEVSISYETHIQQIFANNCTGCHNDPPVNGAPFALNTYERVKNAVENGNVLTAIKRQTGASAAMPPSGRLPQTTIDVIEQWADEGFLRQP